MPDTNRTETKADRLSRRRALALAHALHTGAFVVQYETPHAFRIAFAAMLRYLETGSESAAHSYFQSHILGLLEDANRA